MKMLLEEATAQHLRAAAKEMGIGAETLAAEILGGYLRLWDSTVGQGEALRPSCQRDLSLLPILPGLLLVVACDSDGGIGPKECDTVQVPAYILGRFGTRVPLMEVIAVGAWPFLVVDVLSVEMEPTGREIIRGVADEVQEAGLDPAVALNGSTEDNVLTRATGMGVIVLGLAREGDLKPGRARAGQIVVCVGYPKSAPEDEVRLDDPQIADLPTARKLAALPYISDLLPVGSKGVRYEAEQIAQAAGLTFQALDNPGLDLNKSAGPATCLLASLAEERLTDLRRAVDRPVTVIGYIVAS